MKIGFHLTDYKIRSNKIYRGTLITFSFFLLSVLVAEALVDLKATSFLVLVPLSAVSIVSIFFAYKFPNTNWLRVGLIMIVYLLIEIHFLINPAIFHSIIYWFPFVPLVALIIQGSRAAVIWILIILVSHIANVFYAGQTLGESYVVTIYLKPFFTVGIIFSVSILTTSLLLYTLLGEAYNKVKKNNQELGELKKEIEEKKNLLEKYQRELISISKDEAIFNSGQQQLFKNICKTAVSNLGVNRVSIWLLENHNTQIARQFLFELDNETDDVLILYRNDFPAYFQAIVEKPFIMASDARIHPETKDFTDSYLIPLDIYSMLDCPIIVDKAPIGVICCENQHKQKVWNAEDSLFIQSLADFISTSYKNERIKNLLSEIKSKNHELIEKNNEIGTINQELSSLNEELSTLNETLEETVQFRTRELETQNTQLTEYAFINSHLLRAPLARILGLSSLISKEVTSLKERELMDALIVSTNEMDAIIRKISDILYNGNNLTREDIKSIIDRNLNR